VPPPPEPPPPEPPPPEPPPPETAAAYFCDFTRRRSVHPMELAICGIRDLQEKRERMRERENEREKGEVPNR